MKPAGDILFASINALPVLNKAQAAKDILNTDLSKSFYDQYRNIGMFPLMTKNAGLGKEGTSNSQEGEFAWTDIAPTSIIDWCEEYVFPWLGMRTRVMALITQPGASNNEHIDCSQHEVHTQQHKFRIVLQGKTDTLYWLTNNGHVKAPDVQEAFIMDGGWPHGMTNNSSDVKITLALGAPWSGKDDYGSDLTLLQNRNNYLMPKYIGHLWNKKN